MTTNQDRAADIIWEEQAAGIAKPSDLAQALTDDGILAPDLPAPDDDDYDPSAPGWERSGIFVGVSHKFGSSVTLLDSEPGGVLHIKPEDARALATALLSAANHAEKEQK